MIEADALKARDHSAYVMARGMELVDGRAILPPAFYKHAQSRGTLAEVARLQGSAVDLATIGQRVLDFRVHREDPVVVGRSLDYGMSGETARLTKLRHAIEEATRQREAERAERQTASVSSST